MKTIKIAHFGAYGTNIGDTVALDNIRTRMAKHHAKHYPPNIGDEEEIIQWIPINIVDFIDKNNNIEFAINTIREATEDCVALFIGGGGLLEGGPFNNTQTGWKLPFNELILSELQLQIPIYVIGAGINYFRGVDRFTETGVKGLTSLIENASIFSVRNDGSINSARELLPAEIFEKIKEVPDPGLIYEPGIANDRITVEQMPDYNHVLQPAFNGGANVMAGRFITNDNFRKIINLPTNMKLKILPHTPKDYMHFPPNRKGYQFVWEKDSFKQHSSIYNYRKLLRFYKKIGCSIAMRGHGQMIALALNVPSIYFSTQDKVLNFSERHGLMDFNVDIREDDWHIKLQNTYNKLTTDAGFLAHWYDTRDVLVTQFDFQFEQLISQIAKEIFQK